MYAILCTIWAGGDFYLPTSGIPAGTPGSFAFGDNNHRGKVIARSSCNSQGQAEVHKNIVLLCLRACCMPIRIVAICGSALALHLAETCSAVHQALRVVRLLYPQAYWCKTI